MRRGVCGCYHKLGRRREQQRARLLAERLDAAHLVDERQQLRGLHMHIHVHIHMHRRRPKDMPHLLVDEG